VKWNRWEELVIDEVTVYSENSTPANTLRAKGRDI